MIGKAALIVLGTTAMPIFAASAQVAVNPAPSQPGQNQDLSEIIVTAQKTTQRAQDVPMSLNAVDGRTIRQFGATRLQDIAATVPGLQIDSISGTPGNLGITLRGITTGAQASSTVATYIDDVPIGSSGAYAAGNNFGLDLFPYDVERVEILSGPQGTLYGASSLGGLVKYVTRSPSLSKNSYQFGGDLLTIDHASHVGWAGRGAVNLVIDPDRLALSVSGSHQYVPGFIDNVATGEKDINHGTQDAARAVLRWEPTSKFSLRLAGLYNRSAFHGLGQISVNRAGVPVYGDYRVSTLRPQGQKSTTKLGSATADYDFGFAKLTSITSYSDLETNYTTDSSATFRRIFGVDAAFNTDVRVKKFTEEARLASPTQDRFHWLLGTFYTHEQTEYDQVGLAFVQGTNTPAPISPLINGRIPSRYNELAVFGDATFRITDAWDVSGGARYSHNHQSFTESVAGRLVGGSVNLPEQRSSDDVLTYSASTSYHFNPAAMVYARVASGYRPGGPNVFAPGIPPTFQPDTLTNYEAGVKSTWLDRRLLLNLSAFYIDWRKIQLQGATPTNLAYVANGGRASSKGVEATTNLKVMEGLNVGASVTYTDAKLKDNAPQVAGFAGDRLPLTPKWAAAATIDYRVPISDETQAHFGAVWRYTGARNEYFPHYPLNHRLSSYSALDASAGVDHGPVSANLFVRNLTNKHAYVSWLTSAGPVVLQPRTVGVSLDFRY